MDSSWVIDGTILAILLAYGLTWDLSIAQCYYFLFLLAKCNESFSFCCFLGLLLTWLWVELSAPHTSSTDACSVKVSV